MFVNPYVIGVENLPSVQQLSRLKKYDLVKITHNYERFWVIIMSIDAEKNKIVGIVDNKLWKKHPFKFKSEVTFGFHNIYDIDLFFNSALVSQIKKQLII